MASVLRDSQIDAINHMKNGCILNGGVGSGKSRTALGYYYQLYGGDLKNKRYIRMKEPADLYIITTARKRDTLEWDLELVNFRMSSNPDNSIYKHKIVIDSWNNISKYTNVRRAFFIFDEQRVVGWGTWTKSFLEITKRNKWILLSATPGDTWMDYLPVFVANGYYRNKTDFITQHVIFSRFSKYPKVERYINEFILQQHKNDILVDMNVTRETIRHSVYVKVPYDEVEYKKVVKERWNKFKDEPIKNAGEYCLCLRKVVNLNEDRVKSIIDILKTRKRAIVFYNYNDELDILKNGLKGVGKIAEWNGHKHEELPTGDKWVYLVQYTAGCEGWNCITTDTVIFYSLNYSYKVMEQACGRIDRINTPYKDLYYYHIMSNATIDKMILQALKKKQKFNEKGFSPTFEQD